MENSQHHANGLSNNGPYSQLPGLSSGVSPQQLQQHQTTLPPLQPQHPMATMQSAYNSAPHTPRTPATPNTPGPTNATGGSHMGGQSRYPMTMPGSNYQQYGLPGWRDSASMLAQSMPSMPQHHPIAPAPSQNRQQQPLRPMPVHNIQQQPRVSEANYDQNPYLAQSSLMPEMEPPTHVVGSQGRRGILPSAPGRPAIPTTAEWIKSFVPVKDANGKYPCPCCVKTYLHAKHLKRHMMRHSGDRPYSCALCLDTFSRSDILKRHFAKCSKRRGNPENLSHLSQQQSRVSKSAPGSQKPSPATSTESNPLGLGMHRISNDPALHPFGVIPDGSVPDAASNMTDEQAQQQQQQQQISRANSLHQLTNGGRVEERSMTYPGTMTTNRTNYDQSYSGGGNYAGGVVSTMPSTGMHPSLVVRMQNGENGHSYSQGYDFASHGSGAMQSQSAADLSALHHVRSSMPMPLMGGIHGQHSEYQWPGSYQQVPHGNLMGQYDSSMRIKPNHYDTPMRVKSEPSTENSSSRSSTDGGPWPSANGVAGLSIC